MTEHELKIWPEYFDDVESGKKSFEVRKLDRLFAKGDILWLREWSPMKGYSGRETKKVITYFMNGGQWGLTEGNCILGIAVPIVAQETEDLSEAMELLITDYEELVNKLYPKKDRELYLPCLQRARKSLHKFTIQRRKQ